MSTHSNKPPVTKEELLEKVKQLATPIDFDRLISDGVLEKKGAWYKILDMAKLPEHAKEKITEFSSYGRVKFSKVTKQHHKLVEQLSK